MTNKNGLLILTFFFLTFFFATLGAQDEAWNERLLELSTLTTAVSDYRLGADDLIEVSIFGIEDFNYTQRISATGIINLPFVGRLTAAGMTGIELEEKLKSLLNGRFIRDPQVFVSVKEYKSHPIFILGAVGRPGQYEMTRPLKLIDIIAMAGGLDLRRADDHALIQRRKIDIPGQSGREGPSSELEIIKINLRDLLEKGSLSLNLSLRAGDVIQVPERVTQHFFIMGEVNRAGILDLPVDRDLLLTQALARAGGPMRTAKMNKGTLIRYDDQGGRQEIAVNFKDILEGKERDFAVRPNDIIFIPGSRFKSIGYAVLGFLPGVTSAAAYEAGRRAATIP
ncbi:polysaccharide export protein [Acidobacteria bacterium AH-259-D05]|nr:polysaccharide export protein [Acidobacteria bacterium AH-259-D05]